MWDLDEMVRRNNQAALDYMMGGYKIETEQAPMPPVWALAKLADKLKVGPPLLSDIVECLLKQDTTTAFLKLVREFLPEHEAEIMAEIRPRRLYRFVYLFNRKYFTLPANTDCPLSVWIEHMPVQMLAMSYFAYHELDMRPGYLLLLSLVVYPYEGDERDEENDLIAFAPDELPKTRYKARTSDVDWLRGLVTQLAVNGQWIAPMGFVVGKTAENTIELKMAVNIQDVKEVIARTIAIAKRAGIEAVFNSGGRTAEEKTTAARVPLLDKVTRIVGKELVSQIPGTGWDPEELHRFTDNTEYEGVGDFGNWACSQTGCVLLDTAYENCQFVEGNAEPEFPWTRNNVETLAGDWPKVKTIRQKIDHMVEWLEISPRNRFRTLLEFILEAQATNPPRKERPKRQYDFIAHYCRLDQQEEEDEDDNINQAMHAIR